MLITPETAVADAMMVTQAQVLDNSWYAGSPANYTPGSTDELPNPLTRLLRSRKLGRILQSIQHADGGEWPSVRFINQALRTQYTLPMRSGQGLPFINVLTIFNDRGNNGVKVETSSCWDISEQLKGSYANKPW